MKKARLEELTWSTTTMLADQPTVTPGGPGDQEQDEEPRVAGRLGPLQWDAAARELQGAGLAPHGLLLADGEG